MASAGESIRVDNLRLKPSFEPGSPIAFWSLVAFTYVLLVAPQTSSPLLESLKIAKVVVIVSILTHVAAQLRRGSPVLRWNRETRLILALVGLGGVSVIWSLWPSGSWELLTEEFGKSVVVFLLIANVIDTPHRLRIIVGSMLLWGMLIAEAIIRDYAAGNFIGGDSGRVFGFASPLAENPNDAALLLNILAALGFGFFLATRSRLARALLVVVMVMFADAVMLTLSRGGFIGLVAVVGAIVWHLRKQRLWMLVSLVGVTCIFVFLVPTGYGLRLASIYDISQDGTGSAQARWEATLVGLELMLRRPWGVGLGQSMLGIRALGANMWSHIHNVFLQVGTELGVVGFACFTVLLVTLMRGLRKSLRDLQTVPGTDDLRGLGRGVEVGFVAFIAGGLFAPVAYNFYFYYLAGFSLAVQAMARRRIAGMSLAGKARSVSLTRVS